MTTTQKQNMSEEDIERKISAIIDMVCNNGADLQIDWDNSDFVELMKPTAQHIIDVVLAEHIEEFGCRSSWTPEQQFSYASDVNYEFHRFNLQRYCSDLYRGNFIDDVCDDGAEQQDLMKRVLPTYESKRLAE